MRPHDGLPLVRDDFFVGRPVRDRRWTGSRDATSRVAAVCPFEDVLGHLRAVAAALDHLHAHDPPIVHRDVKPQNVVITHDGRTVLVDFGLAGAASGRRYLDGTPGFLAPEVVAGGRATPASDVFASP